MHATVAGGDTSGKPVSLKLVALHDLLLLKRGLEAYGRPRSSLLPEPLPNPQIAMSAVDSRFTYPMLSVGLSARVSLASLITS